MKENTQGPASFSCHLLRFSFSFTFCTFIQVFTVSFSFFLLEDSWCSCCSFDLFCRSCCCSRHPSLYVSVDPIVWDVVAHFVVVHLVSLSSCQTCQWILGSQETHDTHHRQDMEMILKEKILAGNRGCKKATVKRSS
jgi:hypothetical protein